MKTQSLLIVFLLLIFFNFLILYYVDGRLSLMIYFIFFFVFTVSKGLGIDAVFYFAKQYSI